MIRRVFATLIVLLSLPTAARAWDTRTATHQGTGTPQTEWTSVYLHEGAKLENEHTALSNLAFRALGIAPAVSPLDHVVDLNASLFRADQIGETRYGDAPETDVEERALPLPGQFSGLPDYSYSIYDWANKNVLCPVIPEGVGQYERCHQFLGWMGALNANHFGSQARATYEHYHQVALALAARAKDLRENLSEVEGGLENHRDYVLEREYEALAFEGLAQHFLQDRYSLGHMWERWSTSDYDDLLTNETNRIEDSAFVAVVAGLLHGHQGVTKLPDPMCSPVVNTGLDPFPLELISTLQLVTPSEWTPDDAIYYGGVGDYRLQDALDGTFYGVPIEVSAQVERMVDCLALSWDEVIRAFGEQSPGAHGAHQIRLTRTFSDPQRAICRRDGWATNQAMFDGLAKGLPLDGTSAVIALLENDITGPILFDRRSVTELYFRLAAAAAKAPRGTDMARGGLGKVQTGRPGNEAQPVAGFVEPPNFARLPRRQDDYGGGEYPGRDQETLMGFFNRAHAETWCETSEAMLQPLRASDEKSDREVCAYLADRLYRGTIPGASSPVVETRRGLSGPIEPICALISNAGPEIEGLIDRDAYPYFIHPGYVGEPDQRALPRYGHDFSLDSVANWCDRVPLLETTPDGVAGFASTTGDRVTLVGMNLADVVAATAGGIALTIERTANDEIQLLAPASLRAGRLPIRLTAERSGGRTVESVGTFFLEVADAAGPRNCEYINGEPPFDEPQCPPYDQLATFRSQAELDAIAGVPCIGAIVTLAAGLDAMRPGSLPTNIDFHLAVEGTGLQDLDLTGVERIGGVLRIENNPSLRRIIAPDLEQVARIQIRNNPALVEVVMANDFCVNNNVLVEGVPALRTVALSGLRRASGFAVSNANALETIDLGALERTGTLDNNTPFNVGVFRLAGLPSLTSLTLTALLDVHAGFYVEETGLTAIALPSLRHVVDLRVADNPQLQSLTAPALVSLGSYRQFAPRFVVRGNAILDPEPVSTIPARICRAGGYGGSGFADVYVCANEGGLCEAIAIVNGVEERTPTTSCGLFQCSGSPCDCLYGAIPPCVP